MSSSSSSSSSSDKGSRVIMWCVPRAISSAFAKCMAFVEDTEVWFEPFVYCYLAGVEYKMHTGGDLPMVYEGNEGIFDNAKKMLDLVSQTEHYPERLAFASMKRNLETTTSKNVFVKDMGSSFTEENRQYLPEGYRHTFLIRNPTHSIFSYRKAMYKHFSQLGLLQGEAADEKTYDVERDERYFPPGYFTKELYDHWQYVKENHDSNPVIIDADELLTHPKEVLSAYCNAVGLPYNDGLLKWDASTDVLSEMRASGDNVLAALVNFYGTAMRSSEFMPPSKLPPRDQLPSDVTRCADSVQTYFDEMYAQRLKWKTRSLSDTATG